MTDLRALRDEEQELSDLLGRRVRTRTSITQADVARHEAGHAVAALAMGFDVAAGYVLPRSDRRIEMRLGGFIVAYDSAANKLNYLIFRMIVFAAAGAVAERQPISIGDARDIAQFYHGAPVTAEQRTLLTREAFREAQVILAGRESAIREVARLLLPGGFRSGKRMRQAAGGALALVPEGWFSAAWRVARSAARRPRSLRELIEFTKGKKC